MFKLHSNLMLSSFGHWFCKNPEIHDNNTRSSNRYHQQSVRTSKGLHSIRVCGPLFWNNLPLKLTSVWLPLELTSLSTIYLFKNKLKHFSKIQLHKCARGLLQCMCTVVPFRFGII